MAIELEKKRKEKQEKIDNAIMVINEALVRSWHHANKNEWYDCGQLNGLHPFREMDEVERMYKDVGILVYMRVSMGDRAILIKKM